MSEVIPRLIGLGCAVPNHIRWNDDPIFHWLLENNPKGKDLFKGYSQRRILADNEDLMTIMVPAAQQAMTDACLKPGEIDMLIGTGSISPYRNPNVLSQLHLALGLPAHCWIMPVGGEFSNYNAAVVFADALIRAERATNVLICVGGNWSRNVDYHTPQAISAADGAGACVIARSSDSRRWTLVDQYTITDSSYYGSMVTDADPFNIIPYRGQINQLWTDPYFKITPIGIEGFETFGVTQPPLAATTLLAQHNLTGADIALISHQASSVLMDAWNKAIKPAQYISTSTFSLFANMAVANIPVTLAWAEQEQSIHKDYLLLLAIGTDMHTNALLLHRNS